MPTKIAVVTGTRAEYGLLLPLIRLIRQHRSLELQLVVTGTHLSKEWGMTYHSIQEDGIPISAKLDIQVGGDDFQHIAESTAKALSGLARVFSRLKPDWLILLGDRYETLAAATAAHLAGIPIAHISGGELTAGATDDAFRHAITKMAYLHFTSTKKYRDRVIQLGEDPSRVFLVGAIGIDNIRQLPLLSRKELEKDLGIDLSGPTLLVTFHPVTLERQPADQQFRVLLRALEICMPIRIILTFPNADAGGKSIIRLIKPFAAKHAGQVLATASLGQLRYLSLMKYASAVVGNSSSGIVEAPSLHTPTVDIGTRQKGRIAAASILHVELDKQAIVKGIRKALSKDFATFIRGVKNPYGHGGTAARILKILLRFKKTKDLQKKFYDL